MLIQSPRAVLLALLCTGLWVTEAWAVDEPVKASSPEPEAAVVAAPRSNPFNVKPLDVAALGSKRGGSSDVFSDMSLRGVVADNRAINVATGGNLVTQGALAGATGVPMLVQNTGNNVLIQNATIINLQLK